MTEYEIYSYEAFRKKYQDDIRIVERASIQTVDEKKIYDYIGKLKEGKPNLAGLSDETVSELMSVTKGGSLTLSTVMLFSPYPQAFFPGYGIIASVVPGTQVGDVGEQGERFADNERIEGNIPQMLEEALQFVRRNMRHRTIIDPDTGKRADRTDYPLTAVREAVLNALVHRDYSMHTEAMPIQLLLFEDRDGDQKSGWDLRQDPGRSARESAAGYKKSCAGYGTGSAGCYGEPLLRYTDNPKGDGALRTAAAGIYR